MAKKTESKARNRDYTVLIKPIVTEKTSMIGENSSVVTFEVSDRATKADIREAIANLFEVEVLGVNTMNYRGKIRRRGKSVGTTKSYKKAYVTLGPGQAIDIVEGL